MRGGRRRGRPPDEILFNGERSAGRERAVDAVAPLSLVHIRVVRVEKHPTARLIAMG